MDPATPVDLRSTDLCANAVGYIRAKLCIRVEEQDHIVLKVRKQHVKHRAVPPYWRFEQGRSCTLCDPSQLLPTALGRITIDQQDIAGSEPPSRIGGFRGEHLGTNIDDDAALWGWIEGSKVLAERTVQRWVRRLERPTRDELDRAPLLVAGLPRVTEDRCAKRCYVYS
jgi:hypothetical protein